MSKMRRVMVAGMIANGLTWYDFTLYGYFAPLIGKLFFPLHDPNAQLLASYGVFAAGFLMRPLGALIFGSIGDRYGRKHSFAIAILTMAVSTALIGILPTYASMGIIAPVLLTAIRLLQGIALAGQYSGAMVFTVEHATGRFRGVAGSTAVISLCLGMLLGSLTAAFLSTILGQSQFENWGWRVPFLLGLATAVVGLYIAYHTPETPHYELARSNGDVSSTPIRHVIRSHIGPMLRGVGIYFAVSVPFYTLTVFCTGFLSHTLGMPLNQTYLLTTISIIIMVLYLPCVAFISDTIGRKAVMQCAAVGYFVTAIPVFWAIGHDFAAAHSAIIIFSIVTAAYISAAPAVLVELFTTNIRYTGMALSYNVAAVLGGFTPMVESWLVSKTGESASVGAYIMVCAAISYCSFIGYEDNFMEELS